MNKINFLNTDSLQYDEQEQLVELANLFGKDVLDLIPYPLIKQRAFLSASLAQFEGMLYYDSEKPLRYSDGSLAASFDYQHKTFMLELTIKALQEELHSVTSNILFILQEKGYEF
tara:strand:- start:33222 stop:33566 length:345 start_codon:yes stop_codon:yes gene_type:complete